MAQFLFDSRAIVALISIIIAIVANSIIYQTCFSSLFDYRIHVIIRKSEYAVNNIAKMKCDAMQHPEQRKSQISLFCETVAIIFIGSLDENILNKQSFK